MWFGTFILVASLPLVFTAPTAESSPAAVNDNVAHDYIIVFKKGIETPDRLIQKLGDTLHAVGAVVGYEYRTVIKGFSVSLTQSQIDQVLLTNDVEYPFVIEMDQQARTML